MKTEEQIPHGKIGHFCHGGCAGYAEGGVVDPDSIKESPIIEMLRGFTMKHSGTVSNDQKDVDLAMNVDSSSGTAKGYAEGGVVDAEDEKDPSIIPEDIKDLMDQTHKEQRESRPDENWRITPPEKPESIAPYKRDEEDTEKDPSVLNFAQGGEVPGYYEGGGPDIDQNKLLQDIAPAGTGTLTPPLAMQPPESPTAPPVAPVAPLVPPAAPEPKAPALPVPGKPELTDEDFMTRSSNMLGLNPSEQASFMKLLGRNSQKAQLGAGLAGIGDAIASGGTLGKVNPGNLHNAEDIAQNATKEGIEGMQLLRGNQEKTTDLSLKLQAQDPKSPLSKYAQKAYGGLGKKLGLDLSNASAALIADITGKGVSALNDEAELGLKQAALGLQSKQVDATIGNQKAERDIAREAHQQEAAGKLADRGILKTIAGAIPGTASHEATKVLERAATGGDQAPSGPVKVNSMEEYKALPPGTHYVDSYGTEKVKK